MKTKSSFSIITILFLLIDSTSFSSPLQTESSSYDLLSPGIFPYFSYLYDRKLPSTLLLFPDWSKNDSNSFVSIGKKDQYGTFNDLYLTGQYKGDPNIIGLHIDNSSDIQIVGSDLSGNRYGILMRRSPGIAVTDCTASGNLIDGFYVERSEKCIISFCQLISNSARISNDAAIRVIGSSHTIIQGCEIRMNYGTGIFLQGPMRFCTVLDCDINYNNEGMVLRTISDSRVQGIEFGIDMKAMEMLDVENCSFSDCMVYRNGEGVSMEHVIGCSFERFEFTGSGYGVYLISSHDNLLVENTFTGSKSFDMLIGSPDAPSLSSDRNQIFGNLFQKDAKNLPSVHDNGNDNLWHHQGLGNTWSGWEWDDKDGDRIADTPFEINGTAGSKDMFPTSDVAPRMIDRTDGIIDTSENGGGGHYWYIFIGVLVIFILLSVIIFLKKDRSTG